MNLKNLNRILFNGILCSLFTSLPFMVFAYSEIDHSISTAQIITIDSAVTINGIIHLTDGTPLEDVEIYTLEGNVENILYTTTSSGQFNLTVDIDDVPNLRMRREINYLEQVSTLDLLLILRHILNLKPFLYPFQYVAADINNDEKINITDVVMLRRLLLGKINGFQNNQSWKFYPLEDIYTSPIDILTNGTSTNLQVLTHKYFNDITATKVGNLEFENDVVYNVQKTDTIPPNVELLKLSTAIAEPPACQVELFAIDFDKHSSDNITKEEELRFTFSPVVPGLDPKYNAQSRSSSRSFYASEGINTPFALKVYVWDRNNNYNIGIVYLTIQINDPSCDPGLSKKANLKKE